VNEGYSPNRVGLGTGGLAGTLSAVSAGFDGVSGVGEASFTSGVEGGGDSAPNAGMDALANPKKVKTINICSFKRRFILFPLQKKVNLSLPD